MMVTPALLLELICIDRPKIGNYLQVVNKSVIDVKPHELSRFFTHGTAEQEDQAVVRGWKMKTLNCRELSVLL